MPEGKRHNFRIGRGVDFCQTKYDLKSIMHYPNTAFSTVRGKNSITAKDGTRLPPSWEKSDLSDRDVECLRRYYGCLGSGYTKSDGLFCTVFIFDLMHSFRLTF